MWATNLSNFAFVKQEKLPFVEEKLQTLAGTEELGLQAVVICDFIACPVEMRFVWDTIELSLIYNSMPSVSHRTVTAESRPFSAWAEWTFLCHPVAESSILLPGPSFLPRHHFSNLYRVPLITAPEVSQYLSCCPPLTPSLSVQSVPHIANDRSLLKNSLRIGFLSPDCQTWFGQPAHKHAKRPESAPA